jgi:16S rRNA (guanine527-N7)-methyltransferase
MSLAALEAGAREFGLELTGRQLERFARYRDLLLEWNQRVNLTAIRDPAGVERLHFLDSVACLLGALPEAATVLDVGAGGGFPGLPLQIARPDIELTLLEATAKKTAFMSAVVADLGLDRTHVVTGRAEDFGERESFDAVVARALAPLPVLLELTLPFARVGGQVLALKKGAGLADELAASGRALEALGGRLEPALTYELEDGEERHVVVVRKVRPTPAAYPRRSGLPAKRPL